MVFCNPTCVELEMSGSQSFKVYVHMSAFVHLVNQ